MEKFSYLSFIVMVWLCVLYFSGLGNASRQNIGRISPPFQGAQMDWIDRDGRFLLSNNSNFAFGFIKTTDVSLFVLGIIHVSTKTMIWSANSDSPVSNSDKFAFDESGNVSLQKGGSVIWSTGTSGKGVSTMELQNSGNLVLLGSDDAVIWQSFSHPTNTLLSSQDFTEGMKLTRRGSNNLSYTLEIKSGDITLSTGYQTPQPYWSMAKDTRRIINKAGAEVTVATLSGNSWRFFDKDGNLLSQIPMPTNANLNATWIAVLKDDGTLSFTTLSNDGSSGVQPLVIPSSSCGTPEPCDPYQVCYESDSNKCHCLPALYPSCSSGIDSPCSNSQGSRDLKNAGDNITYFSIGFVSPSMKSSLDSCKASCLRNCSCLALFFQNSTGSCYLLDSVGAFQNSDKSSGFTSFIKVSTNSASGSSGGSGSKKHVRYIVIIIISTVLVIIGLLYVGYWYHKRRRRLPGTPRQSSEEDNFLESLAGMPVRFSYKDLQTATNNFSMKLGQGGFGSVYQGLLPDGTRLAVKKLEGVGQGKKEFRAEVCIIGSIHHLHLVRLKGFCAEGSHRLLAYEYMAKGSLDKWIFKKNPEDVLDWDTRFNIALGTAKGLAYLHEDCDSKIVHCDIKPENVLLDDNFLAKVSDFGLAKLMTREQSHVFTTLRGTRGYLAPEWITNYAISEKSDVYSYGMVLLEIIGGRKNYDPTFTSEKSHFPSYAFRMMEENNIREILDSNLKINHSDERVFTAIKVALWCIQEDMHLRPSMTRVAQMLEGLCPVPKPPTSSPLAARFFSGFLRSSSEEATSSGLSDCNSSDAYLSAVRLSGPR